MLAPSPMRRAFSRRCSSAHCWAVSAGVRSAGLRPRRRRRRWQLAAAGAAARAAAAGATARCAAADEAQRAPAREPDDPTRLEPVVVAVTRTAAAGRPTRRSSGELVPDPRGHQPVAEAGPCRRPLCARSPAFGLFRRSSSLVTHARPPRVSRSAACRPQRHQPRPRAGRRHPGQRRFGGWVYWDRIPLQASSRSRSSAAAARAWAFTAPSRRRRPRSLARRPTGARLYFDGSYGTHNTHELRPPAARGAGACSARRARSGQLHFKTDGYFVRGRTPAGATIDIDGAIRRHHVGTGRAEMVLLARGHAASSPART